MVGGGQDRPSWYDVVIVVVMVVAVVGVLQSHHRSFSILII